MHSTVDFLEALRASRSCVPSFFVSLHRIHHPVKEKSLCRLRVAPVRCVLCSDRMAIRYSQVRSSKPMRVRKRYWRTVKRNFLSAPFMEVGGDLTTRHSSLDPNSPMQSAHFCSIRHRRHRLRLSSIINPHTQLPSPLHEDDACTWQGVFHAQ